LNRDPYGEGWMVRGRPLDWGSDKRRLVGAAGYREHLLKLLPDAEAR
jgi:glycine cleavage system H lipoate-binding protein